MDFLTGAPHYIISLLVLLTVVVFVHELGHFWVARRCGVRVEVFSVGFGPELFGYTDRSGTRWKFSAIPLGGYVKMFGQAERVIEAEGREREMTAAERGVSFHHKTVGQRAAIVFAGPAANYLLTIASFALLIAAVGLPILPMRTLVGDVQPGSAAEAAGIQAGDRIVGIDGESITTFEELLQAVGASEGRPLRLTLQRNGLEIEVIAQPRLQEQVGEGETRARYLLGIMAGAEYEPQSMSAALVTAVTQTYQITIQILDVLWQMIVGERSSDELGGVLRIAKIAGDMAKKNYVDFLYLIPFLSLNLGLLNLFPIPLLDGGHLAFYAVETVRGRPLGERAQEWGMRIGVVLVLGLMVFVTWNDLVYLKVVDFIKDLAT
jgi:regulator of sigma E protease